MASDEGRKAFDWSCWKLLALVIVLTALLRVIVALLPQAIHVDGATQYLPAAEKYYHEGFSAGLTGSMEMPLLPVSIALLTSVTHNFEISARLISLVAGILTVIPLYYLVRALFGAKHAVVAGLLFACCPLFITNSSEVTKESLFGMFFVFGMWLGWLAIARRQLWMCLLAGVVGMLAYMTRPDGLDLFVVWGIWLAVGFVWYLSRDRKQALLRLAMAAVIALPTLALGGAYVAHVYQKTGTLSVSEKKPLWRILAGKERREAEQKASPAKRVALWFVHAALSLREVGRETFNELNAGFFLLVILAFAARRGAVFRGNDRYLLMLCAVQLLVAFLIALHFTTFRGFTMVDSTFSGRHLLSLLLALWCWIAWGLEPLERGARWLLAKLHRPMEAGRPALTAALVAIIFVGMLPSALRAPHSDKLADKPLGAWLKEHASPDVKFMTGDRRIGYYAGLPDESMLRYPRTWETNFNGAIASAVFQKATYMCLSDSEIAKTKGQVDAAVEKGWIRVAFQTSQRKGRNDVLYEVISAPPAKPPARRPAK